MDKEIIKFDDTEIEKDKSHHCKRPILINNIDVNKIVISNKISLGKENFNYSLTIKMRKKKKKFDVYFFQK